jgi:hypothetical protein
VNRSVPGRSARTCPASVFFALLAATFFAVSCGSSSTGPSPPPPSNNAPPVVTAIVVQGTSGPREPAQYATLGETVNVTATVTDAETPVAQLEYQWSSNVGGTFSTNAASVTTAPMVVTAATPVNAVLTLTVTERYGATQSHRVTATSTVDLHNSPKEVGDLAVLFLEEFSRQLPVDVVMRNFTASCPEAAEERAQVAANNNQNLVLNYSIGQATTTVPFSGTCPFRNVRGDACAQVPVSWTARNRSNGAVGTNSGIDQVTALLEGGIWKLCASDYDLRMSTGDAGMATLMSGRY